MHFSYANGSRPARGAGSTHSRARFRNCLDVALRQHLESVLFRPTVRYPLSDDDLAGALSCGNRHQTAVIIPNWDGIEFLRECLDSLAGLVDPATIVVVDNGSVDGSPQMVELEYPHVQLIRLSSNRGFTGGVNAGLRWALEQGYEYCALLNNDAVVAPRWLAELTALLESDAHIGIATGKLLRSGGHTIDSTGDHYSRWGRPFPRGRDELDRGQYDAPSGERVFAATGGASLYRSTMLRSVGLFDDKFFAYYEDVDISFRARLRGWQVAYTSKAVAFHHVGGTSQRISGFARFHAVRNSHYLYWRNMPRSLALKYLPLFFATQFSMFAHDLSRGLVGVNLRAHCSALWNVREIYTDRKAIQKSAVVSPREIEALLWRRMRSGNVFPKA